MSLSPTVASGKPNMPIRLRPTVREGRFIQYKTKDREQNLAILARQLGVSRQAVSRVVRGEIRSARIESEIAKILGKASWNDVVLEARSAVQGKPVEVIIREMEQRREAQRKAFGSLTGKFEKAKTRRRA